MEISNECSATSIEIDCAKFRGLLIIMFIVGLVPSYHCALVSVSGPKFFSRGNFVGPKLFLVINFVIQRFSVVEYMRMRDRKQRYINTSQTAYFIPNRFQQLLALFKLGRYFIY